MAKLKKNEILVEIIRFSTYLILLTPMVVSSRFFFPFVAPKSLYFFALSEIIFFSWLILISLDSRYRPKFNFVLLFLAIYLAIFILASIFGVNSSYSFWSKYERMTGILMHLHLFAFFLVLSSTFKEEDFEKFFSVSIIVAIFISLIALVNLKNPMMRGGGTLGNESFLGTYLLFNLFFALYLVSQNQGGLKIFFISLFLILLISILLTGVNLENLSLFQKISGAFFSQGARAAKISFYGGCVLLFFFWLIASKKLLLKISGTLLLIFSILLAVIAFYSLLTQPEGMVRKMIEREVGSFGGRFPVWQSSWYGFLERPWLGWGPENFEFSFLKHYNPCMPTPECGGEIWFDKAHNIIFDTLISTGILGMISYLLIFASLFYSLWKKFLKKEINFWPAGIFSSLFISYFVQNLTVFDMVSSFMVFFLSLSFVATLGKENEIKREIKELNLFYFCFVIVLFIVCFTFFIILPTLSNTTVISSIRAKPFSEEQLSFFKKSLSLSPLGKNQIRQFLAENVISSLQSLQFSNEILKEEMDFLVSELEKNIKECPLDYRSYLRLGQILTFYSQFEPEKIFEGEQILKKAIEVSPKNQQAYWLLAYNMVYQKRFDEAIFLAQKALDLEPKVQNSHLLLIQALLIAGKTDLAKEKYQQAIKINPQWEESLSNIFQTP
jgi:O-antigen ligase